MKTVSMDLCLCSTVTESRDVIRNCCILSKINDDDDDDDDFKIAPLSIFRCRLTWPLTVSCHLKKIVISCVLPNRGLVLSGGPEDQGPMFRGCRPKAVAQPSCWANGHRL